jgi:hypothetical protein
MLNNTKTTTEQAMAAIELIKIAYTLVAACGKDGKPSGHLYAEMMAAFSDVGQYESMIALMVRTKLLSKSGHLLIAAKV